MPGSTWLDENHLSSQYRSVSTHHVADCRNLETCVDHSVVVELRVEPPVDEGCMRRIAGADRLEYFPTFPRPLFRIRRLHVWAITGIVGDGQLRVTYFSDAPESAAEELRLRIESPS
jgi:hypothetical protein